MKTIPQEELANEHGDRYAKLKMWEYSLVLRALWEDGLLIGSLKELEGGLVCF